MKRVRVGFQSSSATNHLPALGTYPHYMSYGQEDSSPFPMSTNAVKISIALWNNKMLFKYEPSWEGMSFSLSYNALIIGDSII